MSLLTKLQPDDMDYTKTIKNFFILFVMLIGSLTVVTFVYKQSIKGMQNEIRAYGKQASNDHRE